MSEGLYDSRSNARHAETLATLTKTIEEEKSDEILNEKIDVVLELHATEHAIEDRVQLDELNSDVSIGICNEETNTKDEVSNEDNDETNSDIMEKLTLCVLNTQFGKTFVGISQISTLLNQDVELGQSIHMQFTMNTLLNNQQYAKRLETIEETYGQGSICVFSSKYDGKYTHVKSVLELLGLYMNVSTCPRVVVMCSNKRRFDDVVHFLKVIDENKRIVHRAFVYIDEMHAYISPLVRNQIEDIHSLDIVKGITGFTATPDEIFQNKGLWSKVCMIKLGNYDDKNYVGCDDMVFKCIDNVYQTSYSSDSKLKKNHKNIIDFIEYALMTNPEILGNGSRTFIPAHRYSTTHYAVRELLFNINDDIVVAVINGKNKTLKYKDDNGVMQELSLVGKDEELCETISKCISEHNLQSRPYVLTGFVCVEMGQTLTHSSTGSFTSAIFGQVDINPSVMYQLFGRVTGRMKDWSTYIQTQVYCPTSIKEICYGFEACAKNLACEYDGKIVSEEEYREPMKYGPYTYTSKTSKTLKNKKMPNDVEPIIHKFKTIAEAKDYYTKELKVKIGGTGPQRNRKMNAEGYYESSIGKGVDKTKCRTTDEIYHVRKFALNDTHLFTCHPCYKDLNDKSTLEWWLIHY